MPRRPLSRRELLRLASGAVAGLMLGQRSFGQGAAATPIGVVLPAAGKQFRLTPSSVEIAANAALKGAVLAEERATAAGYAEVLFASAPDADAAARAAERLAVRDEVIALVGGIGDGQAAALSRVAAERGILFLNIGSASGELRRAASNTHTFHVEASSRSYMKALVRWYLANGARHLFLVHSGSPNEAELKEVTLEAVNAAGCDDATVTAFELPGSHLYGPAIEAMRVEAPELVLLLLDWRAQLEFLGRYEATGLDAEITGFPVPASQTREFYRAVSSTAPRSGTGPRVALWEATLAEGGASALNDEFFGRWGEAMDPSAWAAYQAIAILQDSVARSGSEVGKLIRFLETAEATFDVAKGEPVGFHASDHQLQQPLYMVEIDPQARENRDLGVLLAKI